MSRRLLHFYVLLGCVVFLGCGKLGKEEPHYIYTLTNNTGEKIEFDIYRSQEDYNHNTNLYKKMVFEPGEKDTVELEALKDYYFDWYNEQGGCSNWLSIMGSTQFQPGIKYTAPKISDELTISTLVDYYDTSRSIILNGGAYSRWVAAQIYDGVTPSGPAPYMEITLKKDLGATLKQKKANGDTTVTNLYYAPIVSYATTYQELFVYLILDRQNPSKHEVTLQFSSYPWAGWHSTRDTLTGTIGEPITGRYSFVRQ